MRNGSSRAGRHSRRAGRRVCARTGPARRTGADDAASRGAGAAAGRRSGVCSAVVESLEGEVCSA